MFVPHYSMKFVVRSLLTFVQGTRGIIDLDIGNVGNAPLT